MKKTTVSMKKHVASVNERRLINSEYQRGFMEGQHSAAMELAECIDRLLDKFNHVARADKLDCDK